MNITLHKVGCHAREPYLRSVRVHARSIVHRIILIKFSAINFFGAILQALESENRRNHGDTVPVYFPWSHLQPRASGRSRVNIKSIISTAMRGTCVAWEIHVVWKVHPEELKPHSRWRLAPKVVPNCVATILDVDEVHARMHPRDWQRDELSTGKGTSDVEG